MKVSDLTGAQLDYWTARAQGIPAERLEIRRVQRTDALICVLRHAAWRTGGDQVFSASTDWHLAGPLLEQRCDRMGFGGQVWNVYANNGAYAYGETPQVAICRAVVRAAFGEEVEEVAVCE